MQIAGKINKIIREMGLRELGQLEQDLVFGDAGAKEVINFLRTKQVDVFIFSIYMRVDTHTHISFRISFNLSICRHFYL